MRKLIFLCLIMVGIMSVQAKTLVIYYSYTNNVNRIVTELTRLIDADIIRVEPAEKGLDYAADNYAIGSALISAIRNKPDDAASYPAIDPVDVDMANYDCIIIGAPLWWSNMAAPLQTFLFQHGKEMVGKKIGLIVSSASSGISGVEGDAKRLIPDGEFLSPSLWIRSSQTSDASSLVKQWLEEIDYASIAGQGDTDVAEAIDLGLSVKWASFNIGATSPEEYGGLYGWGEPTGKLTSENLVDYPSANPPASICSTEYDIATANWGTAWRMPTQSEFEELASKCKWEWSEMNGVNGMKVTGHNGNSIFLPAGASRTGETVSNQVGKRGCYWSGSLWADNADFASYLYFYYNADYVQPARSNRRYIGMSVRAVSTDGGSGISDIVSENTGFTISVDNTMIIVTNISDDTVISVYDIMGNQLYMGKNRQIEINSNGMFLVRANNTTKKIIV